MHQKQLDASQQAKEPHRSALAEANQQAATPCNLHHSRTDTQCERLLQRDVKALDGAAQPVVLQDHAGARLRLLRAREAGKSAQGDCVSAHGRCGGQPHAAALRSQTPPETEQPAKAKHEACHTPATASKAASVSAKASWQQTHHGHHLPAALQRGARALPPVLVLSLDLRHRIRGLAAVLVLLGSERGCGGLLLQASLLRLLGLPGRLLERAGTWVCSAE